MQLLLYILLKKKNQILCLNLGFSIFQPYVYVFFFFWGGGGGGDINFVSFFL